LVAEGNSEERMASHDQQLQVFYTCIVLCIHQLEIELYASQLIEP
jgi:hypothetical protein